MADVFIGQINMFAGNFAPRSYTLCTGQLLPISQYTALFSILGTTYGGDGRTTFGLPNLQSRAPMHWGNGPGLTPRQIGRVGGTNTVALNQAQNASHNHDMKAGAAATTNAPATGVGISDAGLFRRAQLPRAPHARRRDRRDGLRDAPREPPTLPRDQLHHRAQRHLPVAQLTSMPGADRLPLQHLRARISALSAVRCQLGHERVQRAEPSSLPLPDAGTEHGYKRQGLCERAVRADRLSCTHTMARASMLEALDALGAMEPPERSQDASLSGLRQRFIDLDAGIGILDHRKGDAELSHARLSEIVEREEDLARRGAAEIERKAAAQEIERLEAEHAGYVDVLDELRHTIVEELDRALATEAEGRPPVLDRLRHEQFEPCVGQIFRASGGGADPQDLELVGVEVIR